MKKQFEITIFPNMSKKKKRALKLFLIAVPFMIYSFIFEYLPLGGWIYAFSDYKMGQLFWKIDFVGLKNFKKLFSDSDILRVLRNTLAMSLLQLAASPLPIALAIMMNEIRGNKTRKFIQTVTTLPNFISWIVIFGIAFGIFSSNGLWNETLRALGLQPSLTGLIGDADAAWFFQLGLQLWKTLGWNTIIYLAAITGIDSELYDAARVDGANKRQEIRYITIPGVASTYLVLLLLSAAGILSSGFDQYYMFSNNLTLSKLEVLDYYVYKLAFQSGQYSYSIAIGMLQTFVSIVLLTVVNGISKAVRGVSFF